ncbi:MAG: hypothetical protein HC824_21040 [Synechococcales cyanobacterium RM1_1_8]|nr:hypothetical protein [Synechococcales cyanobacterium RM1_1_8]
MPLPISLPQLLSELSVTASGESLYVHKLDGDFCVVSEEDVSLLCDVDETILPPEQVAFIDGIRHILISDDWVDMPSKQALGEDAATLEAFARAKVKPPLLQQLLKLLYSSNGSQQLLDLMADESLEEPWYEYQKEAFRRAVGDRLQAHNIPFIEEAWGGDRETDPAKPTQPNRPSQTDLARRLNPGP